MNTVLIAIAVVLFVVGVHQTFIYGLQASYWAFMFSTGLFFLYQYRVKQEGKEEEDEKTSPEKKNTRPAKKKKKKRR